MTMKCYNPFRCITGLCNKITQCGHLYHKYIVGVYPKYMFQQSKITGREMIRTVALSLIESCKHLSINNGGIINHRGMAKVSLMAKGQCKVLKMWALSTRRLVFQSWCDFLLAV